MASISALGTGSGMDLNTLLSQLSAAEQTRLTPLTTQQTSYKGKLTAYGVLQSALAKLETASTALKKADTLNSTAVSGSNSAFSATTDSAASAGTYSIEVTNLAKAQSLLSTDVPSATDKLGSSDATRTITIAQPGQKEPMKISLTSEQTSLTGIRDAINKQEGSVNASIMKADDNTYYLALTSKDTGTQSEMTISVAGDETLNNFLNYTPSSTGGSGALTQKVKAEDATLSVNGVSITRQSNTITDAPQGVTINLKAVTKEGAPEQLTIVRDNTATKAAIQSFVDAYNSLQTTFGSLTKYTVVETGQDQSTSNGALVGDGTLRSIQTQLKSQLASSQSGDLKTLASIGITQDLDGKLVIDADKLNTALTDKPNSVTAFFVGDGETTGFATQTEKLLNTALDTTLGTLKTATDGINTSLKNLDKQIAATTASIETAIERYKTQFTQLDKLMTSMNSTASFLTQQFES
ncbi:MULTISPECIES: flagellar filament capping protein FliD [Yersinia pseudotuberculosis complex]|uniref:Flagellar hook-associated protein 2 n=1 Tax=Yersinia pseudotuberculosis serotype O:1b (strain IP 31758) TaxID=349747 RepID=A0A0U1QXF4_YERP3|nr:MULTISPECIES: flagellar filament capping protein FliD [Yersinia pseudotuberculosis complex]ABS47324.1 flagellar hook-associated protein 2 [Yersinia pseudotuberculosis IP 31758]MCE4113720.1 flagellar filament capping protein FliD [Yersinia pseudotuberculosis]MCF1162690.1 flagellar filament capping protein FliD [Yersinia pseudotuberculosis]RYC28166.1 flagellar filament capping protein FliD [Yersinia pseudotuberculosis]UFA61963.1 Flagellar cap protein FliD [Yersinia pseudotuberculosis]